MIEPALSAAADLLKTIDVSNPPSGRVWTHPGDTAAIRIAKFPSVIVSKLNNEPGAWIADSFGVGRHAWDMLLSVFLTDGPIVVTTSDKSTINAMKDANEWYKAIADLFYANLTLSGTVDILGDGEGKLFDYITDNIIWEGKQHYGHLFVIPVVQTVCQEVSA